MKKRIEIFVAVIVTAIVLTVGILSLKAYFSEDDDKSEKVEIYDTTSISAAYLSKDTSGLTEHDKTIYDKAYEILDMIITDEMTACEKELAVHDYLTNNVSYDQNYLSVFYGHDKNSETPYGALINHKAICTGYATSFQMFMDMLEIPCKTVIGKNNNNSDHGWNMVKLDNEWYYVDVTWDDPMPETESSAIHKYFNVTEQFLKDNGHIWDTSKLPKADSTKHSYKTVNNKEET